MKLIFIYGPPASGKLTVANKIADLSGVGVFHNHVIRDFVNNMFDTTGDDHNSLVNTLRYETIKHAQKIDKSLVCTFVYDQKLDEKFITSLIKLLRDDIYFVKLTAPKETLISRVSSPDRRKFGKITDPLLYEKELDLIKDEEIVHVNHIKLETEHASPLENARTVMKFASKQNTVLE